MKDLSRAWKLVPRSQCLLHSQKKKVHKPDSQRSSHFFPGAFSLDLCAFAFFYLQIGPIDHENRDSATSTYRRGVALQ